ncbi:MAG TPA: asparagine synthase-related protein [Thermoleophilaceae bacterium]
MTDLRPLEVASGIALGEEPDAEPLPAIARGLTPRVALEQAVVPALERPPCVVSFSGGRDSSAVLAVATHVARREGLPLPIPATLRFPGVPEADESSWQELVLRHLGLGDWHRTQVTDEFEVMGPEAVSALRRHGVLMPLNSYGHAPLLRVAAGGSLLTGFDGDGLFGSWRWHRAASIRGLRTRPRPRDGLTVGLAAAPRRVRAAWLSRRERLPSLSWLHPHVEQAVSRAWTLDRASEPASWKRRIEWYARQRAILLPQRSLELLARDSDTQLVHPFVDRGFLAALSRTGGRSDYAAPRTVWMRSLFADLLPEKVVTRRDKAEMEAVLVGEGARRFADDWDGTGVDEELVHVDALREAWRRGEWLSMTLLHVAWLASNGREARRPSERRGVATKS